MPDLKSRKQEHFSRYVASGMSPLEAYVAAGYSAYNSRSAAARLIKRPEVFGRIEELKTSGQTAIIISADEVHTKARVINELIVLSSMAKDAGSWNAAIRAQELLGKELGMFSDRTEDFVWDGDINKLSKLQRAKLRASLETMVRDNERRQLTPTPSQEEGTQTPILGPQNPPQNPLPDLPETPQQTENGGEGDDRVDGQSSRDEAGDAPDSVKKEPATEPPEDPWT